MSTERPTFPAAADPRVPVRTTVNGIVRELGVAPDRVAAEVVREELGLTGTKIACGQGVCGACTVLLDGVPVASCLLPATSLHARELRTVEDLDRDGLHPIQRAFLAHDALQCGFCTPGFVVAAVAFHDQWRATRGDAVPDRAEIAAALAGHLCRCGAYEGIYAAVKAACTAGPQPPPPHTPRHEGLEKVTGRAVYTVDVRPDGMLEGRTLRSPHAHARLLELDTTAAAALPGVRAVITMTEAGRLVRYAGQEIVAVAADDRATAARALARVHLRYEVFPAALDIDRARDPNAPTVYRRGERRGVPNASEGPLAPTLWRGNLRGPFPWFSTRAQKARRNLRRANGSAGWHRVEGTWRTQVQAHCALEPHACIAAWADGRLTVHASTQAVSQLARDIAQRWHLERDRVVVLAPHVGGGFGAKSGLGPEVRAAVDLARAAGAPVRVVLDRREELLVGGSRPAQELSFALASDAEGRLAGMRLSAYGDAGAAVGNHTSPLFRIMYTGAPKHLVDWDVTTHTPPGKPFRGPGGPPALWALEQAVDAIAHARGEDPLLLRRRWDGNPIRRRLYDWAAALPVWQERDRLAAANGSGGGGDGSGSGGRLRRGVGVAAAAWPYFAHPASQVRVDAGPEGIVASTATQDIGTGTRSAIAGAVAAVFGLDPGAIGVRIGDSRLVEGPMSTGSRTTASVVPCAEEAARWLRDQLLDRAREAMSLKEPRAVPGGIEHREGLVPWSTVLAQGPPLSRVGARRRDHGGYLLPFPVGGLAIGRQVATAVQVSEVEVDVGTGRIRVLGTWAAIGAGRLVAPALALSQVHGGIVQGIGYALYEERRLDPGSGALLNASLDDYRMAGIGDIGPIHVHFDQEGFDDVRGRGVGLGELVTLAPAAAIGNAVFHATGWRPRELPLGADRVLAGLRRR